MNYKIRSICFLFFLFFALLSHAQLQTQNWYFGNFAGITFSTNPPSALLNGSLSTFEGSATVSDANGDLLFYTDGMKVYNQLHQQMPNGFGLLGDPSSAQSGIIVPKPGSQTHYYIFTVDAEGGPNGFRYSEVDITLQGGLGDVIQATKNTLLFTPSVEKVTAVSHANGLYYWVISHGMNNNRYYAYLIDCNGVNSPITSDVGQVEGWPGWGCLASSSDGAKLATAMRIKGFELLDFDNSTGIVSNPILLSNPGGAYGVSFSPNNQVLYACKIEGGELYQWNLAAGSSQAIINSLQTIGVGQGTGSYKGGAIQRGLDGKLYIPHYYQPYLSCINNPNELGNACNLQHFAVNLQNQNAILGLPPFLQTFFQDPISINAVKSCNDVSFTFSNGANFYDSIRWIFGDLPSGINNTSTQLSPSHLYSSSGTFEVLLITHLDCITDTSSYSLTVYSEENIDINESACDTFMWNGNTYTQSGTYEYSSIGLLSGCDSIVSLHLDVFPSFENSLDVTICEGESFEVSDTTLATSGSFYFPLISTSGCDSTVTIQVTLVPKPSAPLIKSNIPECNDEVTVLFVDQTGTDNYWISPDGNTQLTDSLFFMLDNQHVWIYGAYSMNGNCSSDTSYTEVNPVFFFDVNMTEWPNVITVNADGVNDLFEPLVDDQNCLIYDLIILNRWGQVVYNGNQNANKFNGKNTSGEALESGIYFYRVVYPQMEKSGFLHLVH